MHLHIPDHATTVAPQLQNGLTEIWPGLQVPCPRIDDDDITAADSPQGGRPQGRIVPDCLHMPLRERGAIRRIRFHATSFSGSICGSTSALSSFCARARTFGTPKAM